MSVQSAAVAHPHPALAQLAALQHLRVYVDIGVVIVVLAITNLIAQEDAHVLEINSDNVRDTGRAQLRLRLKVSDYDQLSSLLGKLDALPGVNEVRRLG